MLVRRLRGRGITATRTESSMAAPCDLVIGDQRCAVSAAKARWRLKNVRHGEKVYQYKYLEAGWNLLRKAYVAKIKPPHFWLLVEVTNRLVYVVPSYALRASRFIRVPLHRENTRSIVARYKDRYGLLDRDDGQIGA